MNLQELLARLNFLTDPNNAIGAVLYFVVLHEDQEVIRRADIEGDLQSQLRDRFLEYIGEKFIDNEDLSLVDISAADERKNVVFKYDLEVRPEGLNLLNEILLNAVQPIFNFDQDNLSDIKGFLITIGQADNKIALYKKLYPVNLLRQDRFLLFKDDERLAKVPGEVLAIDKSFDFMLIGEELFILNLNTLERNFGFEDVIRAQANEAIEILASGDLLDNAETIMEFAQNLTNAKKLMKLKNSPVLRIPVEHVIDFVRNHPQLSKRLKFNEDETRIALDTATSKKHFLKLLNDDYLYSQLTAMYYDSLAKDELRNEEGNA
jgi:hypothetical protein